MARRSTAPDRVFLDANVLFSAAYRRDAGLRRLWELSKVDLVTSVYALEEARRNLPLAEQRQDLVELTSSIEVVANPGPLLDLPEELDLPENDRPILGAAIAHGCTHLLTGDRRAFGPTFGRRVRGVLISRPAEYLRSR